MIESLFITEADGKVIIEKQGRSQLSRRIIVEYFSNAPDCISIAKIEDYFIFPIKVEQLYILAVCTDAYPMGLYKLLTKGVFYLLRHIAKIFQDYFGDLSPLSIKEHFDIVYELLDEILDNGNPYITELCILKDFVPPPSFFNNIINNLAFGPEFGTTQPKSSISLVPWRSNNVKYSNNEIFIDVIEHVNAVLDRNSNIISAYVSGIIQVNSRLSGMPELILTLSNRRLLQEGVSSLHRCVKYSSFVERQGLLTFIPPGIINRLITRWEFHFS